MIFCTTPGAPAHSKITYGGHVAPVVCASSSHTSYGERSTGFTNDVAPKVLAVVQPGWAVVGDDGVLDTTATASSGTPSGTPRVIISDTRINSPKGARCVRIVTNDVRLPGPQQLRSSVRCWSARSGKCGAIRPT
jgi:hypothetical protein